MTTTNVIILVAFAVYMLIMIAIGFVYSKRTKNNEDYFLGGRNLGGWTAALSAQASDMSGWLLMGLPGSVYLAGTGEIWIAIGLLLGTILNWYLVSSRLTFSSRFIPLRRSARALSSLRRSSATAPAAKWTRLLI